MNLKECFELAFRERDTWRDGKGVRTLRTNVNHCLRILGEDLDIETIKPSTFRKLGFQIIEEGRKEATANRIMAALHTALTEAKLEDEIQNVPSYRRFKEPEALKDYYPKERLTEILEACLELPEHGKLLQQTMTFCYFTGCRRGEAITAEWRNLDWDKQTLTFLDTKNGYNHTVSLHPVVLEMFESMYPNRVDELVFPWNDSNQINGVVRKLKKLASIEFERPMHALRHTCATDLVTAGVDIRSIQALLNHRCIDTTLKYADAKQEAIANAVSNLSF